MNILINNRVNFNGRRRDDWLVKEKEQIIWQYHILFNMSDFFCKQKYLIDPKSGLY